MALRPLGFGVRLRDRKRTLRVVQSVRDPSRFAVEDRREGGAKSRREHASLGDALRDAASAWRGRLH